MHSSTAVLLLASAAIAVFGCGDAGAALDFKVTPLDDQAKSVTLADFKGKTVMLDFWATWCGPCKAAMPEVQQVWEKYHSKGLEIVAISQEERAPVLAFHQASRLTYPVYLDRDGSANMTYAVEAIPRFVLIRDGRVLWSQQGFEKGDVLAQVSKAMD